MMNTCCSEKSASPCCAENTGSSCCSEKSDSCNDTATVAVCAKEVSTELAFKDVLGTWKARWNINRMNYKVDPGLYYVGTADADSPVLVTANYKMSFDVLRKELRSLSAWILVLDTKGVNVWCAAGKGTFGTEELLNRIDAAGLADVVRHRTLILPQLGAVGVSAHEVTRRSGFKVVYGPVRASDVPLFLKNGMKADKEMRRVRFDLIDRTVLTPVELVGALKPSLILFGLMFLLNLTGLTNFTGTDVAAYLGALLFGCVLTPMLLPWILGRAFAWKGWLLGLIGTAGFIALNGFFSGGSHDILTGIAYLLTLPAVSAFCGMNFTGCSTYTSLSGVLREMKLALPLVAASAGLGIILLIAGDLLAKF